MNFNFEIKFDQIISKLTEIIDTIGANQLLSIIKDHKNILGLSFLLISLFTTNRILSKEKNKRKHDQVKDLTPGRIYVLEGKVSFGII
jgi:hypothetical protein